MDERIEKWLVDIKMFIAEIEEFHQNSISDFSKYRTKIIGEAVNRILKADPSFEKRISGSRAIIALGDQVAHAYDNITDEKIWSIMINHLPKLKTEILDLLNSAE